MERPKYHIEIRSGPEDTDGCHQMCLVVIDNNWYQANKDNAAIMEAHGLEVNYVMECHRILQASITNPEQSTSPPTPELSPPPQTGAPTIVTPVPPCSHYAVQLAKILWDMGIAPRRCPQ